MNISLEGYGMQAMLNDQFCELLFTTLDIGSIVSKCNKEIIDSKYTSKVMAGIDTNKVTLTVNRPLLIDITHMIKKIDTSHITKNIAKNCRVIYGLINSDNPLEILDCNSNDSAIEKFAVVRDSSDELDFAIYPILSHSHEHPIYLYIAAGGIDLCKIFMKDKHDKQLVITRYNGYYDYRIYDRSSADNRYTQIEYYYNTNMPAIPVVSTDDFTKRDPDTSAKYYTYEYDDEDDSYESYIVKKPYIHNTNTHTAPLPVNFWLNIKSINYKSARSIGSNLQNKTSIIVDDNNNTSIYYELIRADNTVYYQKSANITPSTSTIVSDLLDECNTIIKKSKLGGKMYGDIHIKQMSNQKIIDTIILTKLYRDTHNTSGACDNDSKMVGLAVRIFYTLDNYSGELVVYNDANETNSWINDTSILPGQLIPCIPDMVISTQSVRKIQIEMDRVYNETKLVCINSADPLWSNGKKGGYIITIENHVRLNIYDLENDIRYSTRIEDNTLTIDDMKNIDIVIDHINKVGCVLTITDVK